MCLQKRLSHIVIFLSMFKERYCVVSFFKKGRIVMFVESPSNIHFVETSSTAVPNNFTDKYVQHRVVAD